MADTTVEGTLEHSLNNNVTVDESITNKGELTSEIDFKTDDKTTIDVSKTTGSDVVTGEIIYDINKTTDIELTKDSAGNTTIEVVKKI